MLLFSTDKNLMAIDTKTGLLFRAPFLVNRFKYDDTFRIALEGKLLLVSESLPSIITADTEVLVNSVAYTEIAEEKEAL